MFNISTDVHPVSRVGVPGVSLEDPLPPLPVRHGETEDDEVGSQHRPQVAPHSSRHEDRGHRPVTSNPLLLPAEIYPGFALIGRDLQSEKIFSS